VGGLAGLKVGAVVDSRGGKGSGPPHIRKNTMAALQSRFLYNALLRSEGDASVGNGHVG
jgi:hypothetical protein